MAKRGPRNPSADRSPGWLGELLASRGLVRPPQEAINLSMAARSKPGFEIDLAELEEAIKEPPTLPPRVPRRKAKR